MINQQTWDRYIASEPGSAVARLWLDKILQHRSGEKIQQLHFYSDDTVERCHKPHIVKRDHELILKMWLSGESITDIAHKMDCTYQVVYRSLIARGLFHRFTPTEIVWAVRSLEDNKSHSTIASELNVLCSDIEAVHDAMNSISFHTGG